MKYAQQATQRSAQLVYDATRRKEAGVGNTVEVAQSRQLLAQTKLLERIATGEANTSEVSLASSISLPPSTRILLKSGSTSLPSIGSLTIEATIAAALIARPEVQASLAKVRAAQSNIDAVAYEGLRTALVVNFAAQELGNASTVTADAAQKAYVNGVGTISDASRATLGLYTAKETLIDSRRTAHHAAANLALALGE